MSGREDLIQRALKVQDPVQAKHILNELHNDHHEEWYDSIQTTAMEGLRAKFMQNLQLKEYLCSTGDLILGEASTNSRWGIGMNLNDPEVLNPNRWLKSGNLLGCSLMNLRKEFIQKHQIATEKAPKKKGKETRPKNLTRNNQVTQNSSK